MAGEVGPNATTSPNDRTDDRAGRQRPILRTMNREGPYPLGVSRSELDRKGRRSLTKTSEFAFSQLPREGPASYEEHTVTKTTDEDPGVRKEWKALSDDFVMKSNTEGVRPSPENNSDNSFKRQVSQPLNSASFGSMGLIVRQHKPDSAQELHSHMNRTTERLQLFPNTAEEGRFNLPKPESVTDSYFNPLTDDRTEHHLPDIQTPVDGSPRSDNNPSDDSTSVDSDGYPLAPGTPSDASNPNYRRRSSLGVGPQDESNLLR
ncbi:hypothetical protein R1flu_020352 [Riccia fluitans]|uniref:Uncharacterized protein n=1 Tax=Riccia fluitans TaxID=41844 RepID=A0ABD1ZPS9_9MARC